MLREGDLQGPDGKVRESRKGYYNPYVTWVSIERIPLHDILPSSSPYSLDNKSEGYCLLLHIETLIDVLCSNMYCLPVSWKHIQMFIKFFKIYFLDRL